MKTTAIVGGGAAGFFAAIHHAQKYPQNQVVIFEKTGKLLEKVRISGGGRCNVTHDCPSLPELLRFYPRGAKFLKQVFPRFMPSHTVDWFEKQGVRLKVEPDGRMFPTTNTSQTIIDLFLRLANQYHIRTHLFSPVKAISVGERFALDLGERGEFVADRVIVAPGGFARESGFDWLKKLGIKIVPPVPSLFTFNIPESPIVSLSGVSVTEARLGMVGHKTEQTGATLITHWGLSGPAVLKLSALAAREIAQTDYHFKTRINWAAKPVADIESKLLEFQQSKKQLISMPVELPERLWRHFLEGLGLQTQAKWAEIPAKDRNRILNKLTNDLYEVKGKTTHKEEFVTCGGVDLEQIDPQTMQVKHIKGLHFAGEVLDIDALTGGFNFQAAWATGFVCAQ